MNCESVAVPPGKPFGSGVLLIVAAAAMLFAFTLLGCGGEDHTLCSCEVHDGVCRCEPGHCFCKGCKAKGHDEIELRIERVEINEFDPADQPAD